MYNKSLNDAAIKFFTDAISEAEPEEKLRIRYLREAALAFLSKPRMETADEVYNSFFDCYQMRNDEFAFFDILDALREYEVTSLGFNQNKRDHFTHSVWVFFMGLGVFSANERYRAAFARSRSKFLYEWGLVSLLHDIGYPVEISFQQFKHYIENMIDIDGDSEKPDPYFEYKNFEELIYLHNSNEDQSFIDRLAAHIATSLNLDPIQVTDGLNNYASIRGTKGFIDHAFYSAIMLMRWNGLLIEYSKLPTELFTHTTVNVASAILLHNYFKRPLASDYSLAPLNANQHPLAYLIMLCDELQEWDRTAYGEENMKKPIAEKCEMVFGDNCFEVAYELSVLIGTKIDGVAEKFTKNKVDTLSKLLNLKDIFPELPSDFVKSTLSNDLRTLPTSSDRHISPRPLFEDMEKVAQIIHSNYCKNHMNTPQGKKTWDECDDHYKYDNISQARHLFSAMAKYGYLVLDPTTVKLDKYNAVDSIDERFVEDFARNEHERWMAGKIQEGWRFGKDRDDDKKLHPAIIPYDNLPENEKEKDRKPLIEFVDSLMSIQKKLYVLKNDDEEVK